MTTASIASTAAEPMITLLIKAKNEKNQPVWAYVEVSARSIDRFNTLASQPDFRLQDHATVLLAGEGEEPPAAVREQMEQSGVQAQELEALIAGYKKGK
jgi:hypothetical protein